MGVGAHFIADKGSLWDVAMLPATQTEFPGKDADHRPASTGRDPSDVTIRYQITVDSAETDQRLDLLHRNILKYGTISNTLSGAVPLEGTLIRKA